MKAQSASIARLVQAFVLAVLAGLGPWARADEPIRIVTEEFPPYNMTVDGRITGLSTEIVEAVLKEIGVQAPIQSMPWARAYDIARNSENVLIYSISRTPQRDKLFKWVGVMAPSDWSLFALRGREVALGRLDDALKHQVATVNQDVGEQYLVSHGFAIGSNLQSSNKYEFNYQKLRMGRVDLWVANDLVAHHLARQAGDDPARTLVRALPLPDLGGDGQYMAFGARTSDAVVERFRKGLDAVKKNGTVDALKRKWL
jgi:polar amino acid transport system substrate-binding protein